MRVEDTLATLPVCMVCGFEHQPTQHVASLVALRKAVCCVCAKPADCIPAKEFGIKTPVNTNVVEALIFQHVKHGLRDIK